MASQYWLVKCEPHECSFDELKTREKRIGYWRGIRNYQARNFIRDQMAKGDLAFFYHSNCDEPGVAGGVSDGSGSFLAHSNVGVGPTAGPEPGTPRAHHPRRRHRHTHQSLRASERSPCLLTKARRLATNSV